MKTRKSSRLPLIAAACCLAFPLPSRASTTTYTWDGSAGDGNWFNGANWSTGAVPGTTQAGNVHDLVVFGAEASGTVDFTPGAPALFDRLQISGLTGPLTLNINGNLTTTHLENTGNDLFGSGTTSGRSLAVNVNSGLYAIENAGFTVQQGHASAPASMTIASGASVLAHAGSTSAYAGYAIQIMSGGTLIVRGSLATRSLESDSSIIGNNNTLRLGGTGGSTLEIDGGTAKLDGISSFTNTGDGHQASLVIKGDADVTFRHGGAGVSFRANRNTNASYTNSISVEGGSTRNHSTLTLGHNADSSRPAYGGTSTMTISGADTTWTQGGTSYIGHGTAVGVLNVESGNFTARSDVYLGGGAATSTAARDAAVDVGGILNISGGTVIVSNAGAGVVHTTAASGTTGSTSSRQYWFGQGEGNWDGTYTGQRLQFAALDGTATALGTGVTYYAVDFSANVGGQDAESFFAVSDRLGGSSANLTGTGGYTAASYFTLGAQLIVGSTMTFAGNETRDIAGTLNMDGGLLVVDELVANMGVGKSTITFNGGEMVVGNTYKNATVSGGLAATGATIDTGSAFVVGDGTGSAGSAIYRMNGGTHVIAHGLSLRSDGRLAGFGATTAVIDGAGTIDPGNGAGIITAPSVNGAGGLGFNFEFTQAGVAPLYGNAEASINDVLRLTAETPFAAALTAGNAVTVYLGVAALAGGEVFTGGFYADAVDFSASIAAAAFTVYILGDGQGSHAYNGANYYTLAEYNSIVGAAFSLERSVIQDTAVFADVPVDGYVTQFTVGGAIPEPRSMALLAGLIAITAGFSVRRHARRPAL